MLRRLALVLVALGVAGGFAFWFLTKPKVVLADALGDYTADLANGATMFHAGGCAECHATPGSKDKTKLGGGLALKSPFGTFNVPNVSPDSKHGIGAWTEAQFVTAVMKGTSPSGAHLYPAFPYASYAHMRIEDVRDLFAYMRTLPPVESEVPPHALQFPFNIRRGVGLWKLLYLDERPFSPDPARSEAWNRGAYLVNGPVHCAECHSPRNLLGGIVESQRFAGGPNPEGRGWIPNISPKGIGDWSEKDVAYMLESGLTPEGDSVGGSMAAVVRNTAQLSSDDRMAIATYIKSLPPRDGPHRKQH
jgi:mono/diheme cytochrome c family protein